MTNAPHRPPSPPPPITTLIVDDSGSVRRSMRLLMETAPDIDVIGEARNGVEAVRLARALRPDVVLMDLRMPGGDGLDAIEALAGIGVKDPIAVVVLTTFHLDEYLYGAFERGAVGFLLKKNPGDIPAAIRAAVNAHALQSPAVRQQMISEYARGRTQARGRHDRQGGPSGGRRAGSGPRDDMKSGRKDARSPGTASLTESLTDRELEIAAAVADGKTNKQIAALLFLSDNTVKWHIANMLAKTGTTDRTQLAVWVHQRGLNP